MVGAPTPAPVAAEAEFIPGYFAGDSCRTLSEARGPQNEISVGARIKYGEDIGTVRYIGEVAGYSGLWYGAEWDDPSRGRHSGCVNGIQYFRTTEPGAGSFVRPNRIAAVITCADAIRKHYAGREDETTAAHCKTVINEWKREMGAPFIEMVGFEKVFKKQGKLEQLTEASVHDECVGSAGDVGSLCPRLQTLDVSRNLFRNWREIITLSAQLPHLTDLDLSKNRLAIEMSDDVLAQNSVHFLSLQKLNLSHCNYEWKDIASLAHLWPRIQELVVAHNSIRAIWPPRRGLLDTLTVLRLDGNELAGWQEVASLGRLTNLKVLSVNDCGLTNIRIPEEQGLFPALEVLLLNRNHIADWRSVSELGKLPGLTKLYFLRNPLHATEDYDTVFQLIIARIPKLQELNGSVVTDETRRGAEYDYLKRHGAEWKSSLAADTAGLFTMQHPRFHALIQKYGLPEDSLLEKQPKHTSLTSKLIEIHLKDEKGTVHTKKFPSNMMVQKLATMAQRLYRSSGNIGPPQLYCLDEQRGNTEIHLDNVMKDLNYFSVRNGDTVLVRWS